MKDIIHTVEINDKTYKIKLVERRMKTIRLKVVEETLVVSGYHITLSKALVLIKNHLDWVDKTLEKSKMLLDKNTTNGINDFEAIFLYGALVKIRRDDNYYYIGEDKFKMPKVFNIDNEYKKIRRFYLSIVEERVNYYKQVFNHDAIIIYKDMRSKYGYNSYLKNTICLSTRLIHLPIHLIDYVIIHEFCHFKIGRASCRERV